MSALSSLEVAYLNHHRQRHSSPKTVKHYEGTFDLFREFLDVHGKPTTGESLNSTTIGEFSTWLDESPARKWRGDTERSIVTIHGHLKDLRAFTRWLHENDKLNALPKIYLPTLPQTLFPILSEEDLRKVYQTKQMTLETEIGKRNRALISFMLDSGTRMAEVAGLKYQDLYLSEGVAQISGKGHRERLVFFSSNTIDAIKLWLTVRGKDTGNLFWLKPAGIRMMIDRIQIEAELPIFHAHQIRHTALTMMLRKKMDSHEVKRVAGHSNILVTERYLSLTKEDLKNAHTMASPVDQVYAQIEPTPSSRRRWSKKAA
jgi:site-specific recombinase XerD